MTLSMRTTATDEDEEKPDAWGGAMVEMLHERRPAAALGDVA